MPHSAELDAVNEVLNDAPEIPGCDIFLEEMEAALSSDNVRMSTQEARAFALLAEQSVRRGIDYATLRQGWDHPDNRMAYREARHRSFTCAASRQRQASSKEHLLHLLRSIQTGEATPATVIPSALLRELGVLESEYQPTFPGVLAALENELLLPLRALHEGQESMTRTFNGAAVPAEPIAATVHALIANVVKGTYKEWRYSNPVGLRQLEGLSDEQKAAWAESASMDHPGELRTHEDQPDDLGLFWATKIGGPSHGFDVEGQCLLPLVCNARHKVLLVSVPDWPHYPVGRAHFRLLWTATDGKPLLWLETVNSDFRARVSSKKWPPAVVKHAVAKAEKMGVMLWIDNHLTPLLRAASEGKGEVRRMQDRLILRPSNGVVEASDYLDSRHDWPQMSEEATSVLVRVAFIPSAIAFD
ncbi:hypothetical protein CYMTET_30626 [Cymbomonas tetramitiformis]|uniref:Uncharacterized protein n=1 Tax=Cymbomonas tetramitiformis TaxID=36881 RepID=A0AAE0FIR7_9CHLO|nr:hypothetical protein CYMTET_30626 [Cymbomonas tetramitiformis]